MKMMATLANPPLKRSAVRRFLRSYFSRIIIGLILVFATSSWLWWQTFAESRKEDRIAEKIWNAGGGVYREGILGMRKGVRNHYY